MSPMRRWIACLLTCLCLLAGAAPANAETPPPSCALVAEANARAAVSDPDHAYAVAIYGLEGPCSRDAVPDGLEWLRAGVRLGSAEAMRDLALAKRWGSHGLESDRASSHSLFGSAAEAGDPVSMYEYAMELLDRSYNRGWRMSNQARAIPWLEKAAASGVALAYKALAITYMHPDWQDGPYAADENRAATYFRLASEQGDRLAQIGVSEVLALGIGQPVDMEAGANFRDRALADLAVGDGLPIDFRFMVLRPYRISGCAIWERHESMWDAKMFGENPFLTAPQALIDEALANSLLDQLACSHYGHIVRMPLDEQIETRKWSYIRAGLSGSDIEAEMWRTLLTPEQDAEAARQADQWLFERQVEWTARQAE